MKRFGFVVFAVVLSLFVSSNLIARENTQRGKIVVRIYDDFVNKKSKKEYFLQLKDTTLVPISTKHISDSPPQQGQRAILSPKGKLHYSRNKAGVTIDKISGKINVLIALIQPSGEDAPWEAEKAKEYFQSSKEFFEDPRQHSQVELSVKIVGWLKSEKTAKELPEGFSKIMEEAIRLSDDSVDFREVDCFFMVFVDSEGVIDTKNASLGEYFHSTSDGNLKFSDVLMDTFWFEKGPFYNSHEMGHALLRLLHNGGTNVARKNICGYNEGKIREYGDYFSVMGGTPSFLPLWIQDLLGWLPKERIAILSNSASVELYPREVENAEGKQLVIIETGDAPLSLEMYIIELESYLGSDRISFKDNALLLRRHIDKVYTSNGGYDSIVFCHETNNYESFLYPGEEICGLGTKGEISIKYVSLEGEGEGARAKVEISFYCPEEIAPSVSVSSEATTLNAGQSLTAYVSVGNQMTVGCGTRTVNVEADLPAATWSAVFSPSTLEIAPTATSTTSVLVGIPESALPGFYNLTFRASDNETNLAGEAGLTVEVLCEADTMMVSPPSPMKLAKKTSKEVTVTVTGADGCAIEGEPVAATVTSGKKRIKVSPSSGETDENGQITYTITAKKKIIIGKAKKAEVSFQSGNLQSLMSVKVSKK